MRLYNFQRRFVPMILAGEKTHTIRGIRAHPDKPGNTLHLYTGLRTKEAKLLMRVTCAAIEEIEIWQDDPNCFSIKVEEQTLSTDECYRLARRDGFSDFTEMMCFWDGRLPFRGHVIHWKTP